MTDQLVVPIFSLLKYDNPVAVRDPSSGKRKSDSPSLQKSFSIGSANGVGPRPAPLPLAPTPPGTNDKNGTNRSRTGDSRTDIRREAQDAINMILPPKEWREGDQIWRQQVSSTPATRLDVLSLQEQLDSRLKQRQARDIGICPVRRELYQQCFDELIRQVTVSCAERGFLLARVRDELNLTLLSYQTLYESSLAFGVRKALQAEDGRASMEEKIEKMAQIEQQLQHKIDNLQVELERNARRAQEDLEALKKQHAEEVEFLQRSNQQLKGLLEGVLTAQK